MFCLTIERRAPDQWAVVRRFSRCLSDTGEWDFEPTPSERTERRVHPDWKRHHRFTLEEATRLAVEAVHHVVVNRRHVVNGEVVRAD